MSSHLCFYFATPFHLHNDKYCTERVADGVRKYIPYEPRPRSPMFCYYADITVCRKKTTKQLLSHNKKQVWYCLSTQKNAAPTSSPDSSILGVKMSLAIFTWSWVQRLAVWGTVVHWEQWTLFLRCKCLACFIEFLRRIVHKTENRKTSSEVQKLHTCTQSVTSAVNY